MAPVHGSQYLDRARVAPGPCASKILRVTLEFFDPPGTHRDANTRALTFPKHRAQGWIVMRRQLMDEILKRHLGIAQKPEKP